MNSTLRSKKMLYVMTPGVVKFVLSVMKTLGIKEYSTKTDDPELVNRLNGRAIDAAKKKILPLYGSIVPVFIVGSIICEGGADVFRNSDEMKTRFRKFFADLLNCRPDVREALGVDAAKVEKMSDTDLTEYRAALSRAGLNIGDLMFWRVTTKSLSFRCPGAEALRQIITALGKGRYAVNLNIDHDAAVEAMTTRFFKEHEKMLKEQAAKKEAAKTAKKE